MKELNKYSMYSQLVAQESKSEDDALKIISIIQDFKQMNTLDKVRKYLAEKMNINDNIQNYPLGANSYLNIIEKAKVCVIRFETEDGNYSFCYDKK